MSPTQWRHRGGTLALAGGLALFLTAGPAAQSQPALDLPRLLDAYADGRFDEALEPARRATKDRTQALRRALMVSGTVWVDAVPADRTRRTLVAAAFALEAESLAAERGEWRDLENPPGCAGRCVLEWACTLLQTRGDVDDGERIWYAATIALAGGVRDWTFVAPSTAPSRSAAKKARPLAHVEHALARAPDDPRLRLARALALAARYLVGVEMEAPQQGRRTGPAPDSMVIIMPPFAGLRPVVSLTSAMQELRNLVADPVVGAEARLRLGYLLWRNGDYAAALDESRAAAEAAQDPDVRYLAWFIAAQAAQPLGRLDQAEELLAAALVARPHSQSASLALAALQFRRGDADAAYGLVERTRASRPADDDPWRLFLYGDYPRLPGLMERLRAAVHR